MSWWNKRTRISLWIAILCIALGIYFHPARFGLTYRLENRIQDYLFVYGRKAPKDPRLVYLAIDHASTTLDFLEPEVIEASPALRMMKQGYPYPRELYPLILERLFQAGARVVAIDLLFLAPREGDELFKAVLDKYPDRIVLGANFGESNQGGNEWQTLAAPAETLIPLKRPLDDRVAYVNFWPDVDDVLRKATYHTTLLEVNKWPPAAGDEVYDSLAAKVLKKIGEGEKVPQGTKSVRFRFVDSPGFVPHSIYELFDEAHWNSPKYDGGKFFQDKIVLIGPEGNWSKDQVLTPHGLMAGPEVHLNAMNAALQQEFLSEPLVPVTTASIILAGLFAWMLAVGVRVPSKRFACFFLGLVFYGGLVWVLYNRAKNFPPMAMPMFAFLSSGIVSLIWEYVEERIEKARIRRTFERYVSKNLVAEIVGNPESFLNTLGGVRRPVVILFTDLRGFTSMTENADAVQLVNQLNEYFTEMVSHVFENKGTLDKFIGDAIMAVWGNLKSEGASRDVELAMTTALHMKSGLERLNKEWEKKGWTQLAMGFGVNYGEAIVGNIGSIQKMEPTVIGDPVNLASRLEGLTKEYGLDILIGENAAEQVRDLFHLQWVDYVQVKGKSRPIEVFTVLGAKNEPFDGMLKDYLAAYEQAVWVYQNRDFEGAAVAFKRCLEIRANDSLASVYLKRCAELLQNPPPTDWDGVYVMKSK